MAILDVACIDGRIGRSLEPNRGCGQEDLCNSQILIIPLPFCIITHHNLAILFLSMLLVIFCNAAWGRCPSVLCT